MAQKNVTCHDIKVYLVFPGRSQTFVCYITISVGSRFLPLTLLLVYCCLLVYANYIQNAAAPFVL